MSKPGVSRRSCGPATDVETSGVCLNSDTVERLLRDERFYYLSEMMNWPGVLNEHPEVMAKISAAHRFGKPVDGHAPGLRGQDAARYAGARITTDHECFTLEEAPDKAAAFGREFSAHPVAITDLIQAGQRAPTSRIHSRAINS